VALKAPSPPDAVKQRMRSVTNIQKITKAMKMVAASKLRVAQAATFESRGIIQPIIKLLGEFPGAQTINQPCLSSVPSFCHLFSPFLGFRCSAPQAALLSESDIGGGSGPVIKAAGGVPRRTTLPQDWISS